MSETLDVYQKVDKYLSNEMTEEEVKDFKKQLERFPTIREMVENREQLIKAKERVFLNPENEFSAN